MVPRLYDPDWPADEPYRPHTRKVGYHFGQRKLLMSEIEFLTQEGSQSDLVVYVGAAPGLHIRTLADMFPLHRFVLYDPFDFHPRLADPSWPGAKRITLRRELFTEETARAYAGKGCLLISDIRHKEESDQYPSEESVRQDMDHQRRWVEEMQPSACMLKFRLPWVEGRETPGVETLEYLDGHLFLPVWGCPSTTETRLVARAPFRTRVWNCERYERQMFYFNTIIRQTEYEGERYDPSAETHILRQYIQQCAPRQKLCQVRNRILRELLHTR